MKDNRLAVLKEIAEQLNDHFIEWALGGSMLLAFHNMTDDADDLDLMILESDAKRVEEIFDRLGVREKSKSSEKYQTRCFMEYVVQGVSVDIMAGFTIVKEDQTHYLPLESEGIEEIIYWRRAWIPLQSVSRWEQYYEWMGRNEKVEMIRSKYQGVDKETKIENGCRSYR